MTGAYIAKIINYANILLVCAVSFFAAIGGIKALFKVCRRNIFGDSLLLNAICYASLVAFVVEGTAMNYGHYLKYFGGGEIRTLDPSPDNPSILLTSDGTVAEIIFNKQDSAVALKDSGTAAELSDSRMVTALKDGVAAESPKNISVPPLPKDSALAHKDSALAHKDSALAYKDSALAPKDSALAYKDSALAPKDSALAYKDSIAARKDSIAAHKDSIAALSDSAMMAQGWLYKVVFKNVDRRVSSIFVDLGYGHLVQPQVFIEMADQESEYFFRKRLHRALPHKSYIPLNVCGNVSEIKISIGANIDTLNEAPLQIAGFAINKQIPYYFSGLRLLVVAFAALAVLAFFDRRLRAAAAGFFFDYKFDPSSRKQRCVYAAVVAVLILFAWFCAYTSASGKPPRTPQPLQYSKYLVDALIEGRLHLEAGNPEKLLDAERPYDLRWLEENGYERNVDWMADWAYYKGKLYCYFGAVPAVILFVPYKLITGDYLTNQGGVFVFMAASIVLLALLWRFLTKKYMPNAPFAFYLLSFIALFFANGFVAPLRFPAFYSIVSSAGFMFTVAGIYLLLVSIEKEKTNYAALFFACLSLALIVGCRPNLLIVSLIVPALLWRRRSWKLLLCVAAPYILVAIPICLYNHARFGSIFDFGVKYNMTSLNLAAYALIDPIGKAINTFHAYVSYLFTLNRYSIFFPYVECLPMHDRFIRGGQFFYDKGCGIINFPIVVCLFYYFRNLLHKERPNTFKLSSIMLAVAALIVLVNSYMIGFSGRYAIDFATLIVIPSLFCAYLWYSGQPDRDRQTLCQKIVYALLTVSILIGLFLFATSVTNESTYSDPVVFRYLQESLGFVGAI